jgi:hypothetical protein
MKIVVDKVISDCYLNKLYPTLDINQVEIIELDFSSFTRSCVCCVFIHNNSKHRFFATVVLLDNDGYPL